MGGRGRGGGSRGGAAKNYSREQLTSLGITGNELLPRPVTQPPPLYPMLERKPVPLVPTPESDYLLLLRQDFVEHMQLSSAFLRMPNIKSDRSENEIDKLLAQLPSTKEKFHWCLFPAELRPKVSAKRQKACVVQKEIDINQRLKQLESIESKTNEDVLLDVNNIKQEVKVEDASDAENENVDREVALHSEEEPDEEMDDGTDYANNYFDNGEAFEDEDDNLDDGPIY